MSTDISIW